MSNERTFWAGVAGALNPEWLVRLGSAWGPGQDSISGHDFFVYAVAASTGRMWSAAMATSEVRRLVAAAASADSVLRDAEQFAAQAIHESGLEPEEGRPAAANEALLLASAVAITRTKTFAGARPGVGGANTHCLYLAYKTASGEFIGRPGLVVTKLAGFLPTDKLIGFVRAAVASDTGRTGTYVSGAIEAGGGVQVAEVFR
ncbi:hypothetical protein [Ottowia sp.]|uniref:hypothetical protein n=1 Tax=Ottowia sp. TaxID=1898956 RepID=UPI0025E0D4C0|nr:hypothetical protein [Ottowia sp.]MBK6616505.1 hypothetical protein [Ottowia sp.]